MEPGQIAITRGGTTLLLHHGTPYRVTQFDPYQRSVRADQSGTVPWGDGDWSGAEWRAGGSIPLAVSIRTASWSEMMAAWWALDAALAPVRTGPDVELSWNAAGTEYLMYVRPRGAALVNQLGRTGKTQATATIAAPDPSVYSAVEHSVTLGLLHRIGGVSVPFGTPVAISSVVADGEALITNAGTAPSRLLLHFTGPLIRPRVSLITDAGAVTLYLDTVLGADDWLDIDTKDKLVVLNGTVSRLADQYGAWPLLQPGDATLQFTSDDYNPAARLTARWRDTY